MSQNKQPKKSSPWFQCEKCHINLLCKDTETHSLDCPPKSHSFNFINDHVLYGTLDVKSNETIKGVADTDNLVFLSQSVIQLCSLSIGEWALVKCKNDKVAPVAKIVWPTIEKTLTSVLLTKNALELSFQEVNSPVSVTRMKTPVPDASCISVVILNGSKNLEITKELINRISKNQVDKIFTVGNKVGLLYFGKVLHFDIKSIQGPSNYNTPVDVFFDRLSFDNFYKTTERTVWKLFVDEIKFKKVESGDGLSLVQLGGLQDEIFEIQEAVNACFHKSDSYGLKQAKSILLFGNSGTGKTHLVNAIAAASKLATITICAPDLYSKYSGNPEEVITKLFNDAMQQAPCIIILDEVDILCPVRTQRMTESEKRVVSTIISMFDKISDLDIFVLGTTNKIDSIDPVLRRCGRFDREIEIPTPNPKSRQQILNKLLSNVAINLSRDELCDISLNTHGFVGSDLLSLCTRAGLMASKRLAPKVEFCDFTLALKHVRPSAMREVQVEVANVRWSDIGGQENLKLILRQAVEWPLRHADSFLRMGITPPRGVLMFGPPGCSKTMIAKALATESGLNFLSIKGPELFSKWVGDSEKAVREVFRKARQVAPSIIFFDEIDALGGERGGGSSTSVQERVLAQLLTELDGVSPLGDVTVLAATNRPDRIDRALLRPGRLDRIVYVPLPESGTRREIFKLKLHKMPVRGVEIEELVAETEGYSGAEVNAVCHEAAMMALEESLQADSVEKRHFDKALKLVTPRTCRDLIKLYEDYTAK